MTFVTVTVNIQTGSIICVDGPFENSDAAEEHAGLMEFRHTKRNAADRIKTTAQVVTKP